MIDTIFSKIKLNNGYEMPRYGTGPDLPDADAVLLSYTSQINRYILERCPNVRYIGMCCSLYSQIGRAHV